MQQRPNTPDTYRSLEKPRIALARSKAMNCNNLIVLARRGLIGPLSTLSAEAALIFQRYGFSNGIVLGTTLVLVGYFQDAAHRNGMRPLLVHLSLFAATPTIIAQRALPGFVPC
jgi:hypothetical protein